jgi:hypothetical protein
MNDLEKKFIKEFQKLIEKYDLIIEKGSMGFDDSAEETFFFINNGRERRDEIFLEMEEILKEIRDGKSN